MEEARKWVPPLDPDLPEQSECPVCSTRNFVNTDGSYGPCQVCRYEGFL